MNGNWYHGNAAEDGQQTRGWLLGAFIDPAEGVRSSKDVEVKWGIHPLGDKRAEWTADDQRTTMVVLVEGTFRIDLSEGSTTLAKQGDYLVWGLTILGRRWSRRSSPFGGHPPQRNPVTP